MEILYQCKDCSHKHLSDQPGIRSHCIKCGSKYIIALPFENMVQFRYTRSLNRFWSKVNIKGTNDCWIWLGAKHLNNYGAFSSNHVIYLAHRFAYEISKYPIPKGKWVLHTCDNPSCVNPNHLFLGNCQLNHDDMVSKKRSTVGEKNPSAKLSLEQVKEIKHLYLSSKITQKVLADRYLIHPQQVFNIIHNISWKGV